MDGTYPVSQERSSYVQRAEVTEPSGSLVSRMTSVVVNCLRSPEGKRTSQVLLTLSATLLTVAFFTNPFGISLGVVTTVFLVSALVISALSMELLKSNKPSSLPFIEGRPSILQNDFIQECGQIDVERNYLDESVGNLCIDSLHERVKDEILGDTLLEQIYDFRTRYPGRRKDIIALKNILIRNGRGLERAITVEDYERSLDLNLDQLVVDIGRGRRIRLEEELLPVGGFDRFETKRRISQSIESIYPDLSPVEKNILVSHLHHGALFDFEKDLGEWFMKIKDSENITVRRNPEDGSFFIEMDLLLQTTGEPSRAPLNSEDEAYKLEIARKFGMVCVFRGARDYEDGRPYIDDTFLRSIAGTAKAHIDLLPEFNKKYLRLGQVERAPLFEGDLEDVSLGSRTSSFAEEVPPPSQRGRGFFSTLFRGKERRPSREDEPIDTDTVFYWGPSVDEAPDEIGVRRDSYQRLTFEDYDEDALDT